jgi:transposase
MIDEVSKRVNPDEVWVVADPAMLTCDNRKVLSDARAGYVLGASLKKLDKTSREYR